MSNPYIEAIEAVRDTFYRDDFLDAIDFNLSVEATCKFILDEIEKQLKENPPLMATTVYHTCETCDKNVAQRGQVRIHVEPESPGELGMGPYMLIEMEEAEAEDNDDDDDNIDMDGLGWQV